MTEKKPTLEYRTPQPKGNWWHTERGERMHLLISVGILFLVAWLVFGGCYFI